MPVNAEGSSRNHFRLWRMQKRSVNHWVFRSRSTMWFNLKSVIGELFLEKPLHARQNLVNFPFHLFSLSRSISVVKCFYTRDGIVALAIWSSGSIRRNAVKVDRRTIHQQFSTLSRNDKAAKKAISNHNFQLSDDSICDTNIFAYRTRLNEIIGSRLVTPVRLKNCGNRRVLNANYNQSRKSN